MGTKLRLPTFFFFLLYRSNHCQFQINSFQQNSANHEEPWADLLELFFLVLFSATNAVLNIKIDLNWFGEICCVRLPFWCGNIIPYNMFYEVYISFISLLYYILRLTNQCVLEDYQLITISTWFWLVYSLLFLNSQRIQRISNRMLYLIHEVRQLLYQNRRA